MKNELQRLQDRFDRLEADHLALHVAIGVDEHIIFSLLAASGNTAKAHKVWRHGIALLQTDTAMRRAVLDAPRERALSAVCKQAAEARIQAWERAFSELLPPFDPDAP
jgi:hypothetical protein